MKISPLLSAALGLLGGIAIGIWLKPNPPAPLVARHPPPASPVVAAKATHASDSRPEERRAVAPIPLEESPARPEAVLPAELELRHSLERVGFSLASESNEKAFAHLATLTVPRDRAAFIGGMFAHAAQRNAREAIALARHLEKQGERDIALFALLSAWRKDDEFSALRMAGAISESGVAGVLGGFLLGKNEPDIETVTMLANEFLTKGQQASLLGDAASRLAKTDPQRAYDLGGHLHGNNQLEFLRSFAAGWAAADVNASWEWSVQIADPVMRAELQASILHRQSSDDPQAAAARLGSLPLGTAGRERAAEGIAEEWAAKDTEPAREWIAGLTDPAEREAAMRGFARSAPVGIGAVLTGSPDGYPEVREVVPGGAASQAGTLPPGSRIVAIADANGRWVDTRAVDLSEAIGHIRGAPNSFASLRILPPGVADPAQAKVINIQRSQIIHRQKP